MSTDLQLGYLQRHAAACRAAAAAENDPVMKAVHLANAAHYLGEIKSLRAEDADVSEAA